MNLESYFTTDCGRVRDINEDAGGIYTNQTGQLLAIVADGMGGHQAGEVASDLAVKIAAEKWQQVTQVEDEKAAEMWLKQMIDEMNEAIYQQASKSNQLIGMGTTIVVAICTATFVTIGHVGDSRCYLWSKDEKIKRITSDHSLVNELVRTGQISEFDAEQHPRKNVLLQAIGTEDTVSPDIQSILWKQGDCLILCSDGLTNKVLDEELDEAIKTMASLEQVTEDLVTLANERGGEDNITIAIVCNKASEEVGDPTC